MKRSGLVLLTVGVGLVGASAAFALLAETPVLTSPRNEITPAAGVNASGSTEFLVYARSRPNRPNVYDVYLRTTDTTTEPDTVSTVKLNTSGQGYGGGVDADRAVYQQVSAGSDLRLYELATGARAEPAGVNSRQWEWHPTISGDWVLFGRRKFSRPRRDQILLKNLDTGELRVLASVRGISLHPGQVNGDFATWFRCTDVCNSFVHEIGAEATTRLARPAASGIRHQYATAVSPDGEVYLARSGNGCGANAKIVRYGSSDPATGTVVVALPRGVDMLAAFVRSRPTTGNELFYDRVNCGNRRWDVYQVVDP